MTPGLGLGVVGAGGFATLLLDATASVPGAPYDGPGRVDSGAIGAQADSPAPGALLDALMLEPLVSHLPLGGDGHRTAVLCSAADTRQTRMITVPGTGTARVTVLDGLGRTLSTERTTAQQISVTVPPGGFALVRR